MSQTWCIHPIYGNVLNVTCASESFADLTCHESVATLMCTYSHTWHVSFADLTYLIQTGDMPHSHTWQAPFTYCMLRLILLRAMTDPACDMNRPYMTRSHTWHASFADLTCRESVGNTYVHVRRLATRMCTYEDAGTYLHPSHDSFTHVTCLVYTRDMSHSQMWHDSFSCAKPLQLAHDADSWFYESVARPKCTRDMTNLRAWHDFFAHAVRLILTRDMTCSQWARQWAFLFIRTGYVLEESCHVWEWGIQDVRRSHEQVIWGGFG